MSLRSQMYFAEKAVLGNFAQLFYFSPVPTRKPFSLLLSYIWYQSIRSLMLPSLPLGEVEKLK
jgi:hypothetical protein